MAVYKLQALKQELDIAANCKCQENTRGRPVNADEKSTLIGLLYLWNMTLYFLFAELFIAIQVMISTFYFLLSSKIYHVSSVEFSKFCWTVKHIFALPGACTC